MTVPVSPNPKTRDEDVTVEYAVLCATRKVHPLTPLMLPPTGDIRTALRICDEAGCGPHDYCKRNIRVSSWRLAL